MHMPLIMSLHGNGKPTQSFPNATALKVELVLADFAKRSERLAKGLRFTAHRSNGTTAYGVHEEVVVMGGGGTLSVTIGPNQLLTLRSTA
eukprot:COSAG05_NODE_327_length_11345_cov_16.236884_3_plen_90_part_00